MGKKAIILYISRVVNYSYEFHFDQNRLCPNWRAALLLCPCLCLLGWIRWRSMPKLSIASPASSRYGSTHLFADSQGQAQTAHPAWLRRVSTPMASVCVQPKGSLSKGGLDCPSQWQPREHPWVWSSVALWGSSMVNTRPPATASELSNIVP